MSVRSPPGGTDGAARRQDRGQAGDPAAPLHARRVQLQPGARAACRGQRARLHPLWRSNRHRGRLHCNQRGALCAVPQRLQPALRRSEPDQAAGLHRHHAIDARAVLGRRRPRHLARPVLFRLSLRHLPLEHARADDGDAVHARGLCPGDQPSHALAAGVDPERAAGVVQLDAARTNAAVVLDDRRAHPRAARPPAREEARAAGRDRHHPGDGDARRGHRALQPCVLHREPGPCARPGAAP